MWHVRFAATATGRHALVIVVGLSTELEAAGETTGSAATLLEASTAKAGITTTKVEASTATATATVHHLEDNLGVDATHATAHAATVAEHVGRVDQIFTAVVTSSLPMNGLTSELVSC